MSTTNSKSKRTNPTKDTFGHLDDTLSGKISSQTGKPVEQTVGMEYQPTREKRTGFLFNSVLIINGLFARHHTKLTKNIGILGLIVGLITVIQTQRQLTTSQNNFRQEIDIQTKSASALLISDYLNELNTTNFRDSNISLTEEEFIGAKTQFVLNGISHSTLRAEVLTFMGNTELGSFISATQRKKKSGEQQFKALVSLASISFDDGVISGSFKNGIFSLASFQNTKLDHINITGAALHYTDLRRTTITGGDFTSTHFLCSTLANAEVLQSTPIFSNGQIRMTDLRGFSFSDPVVSRSKYESSAMMLASILEESEIESVLVDRDVYNLLSEEKRKSTITTKMNSDEWFSQVIKNRLCDERKITFSKKIKPNTVFALDL